ncbi:hypothetical protein GQ55_5G221800 [Panicum hallii var. hallii]|uniref:Transmembrane protein n=1 Tax=Panicum hallii var. hallii TaxID=1504633 RepID=A0A2T7DJ15_9POAL|nr:hypothetical protein GQ55_5G221800 [Panicum hallii var. hallii]
MAALQTSPSCSSSSILLHPLHCASVPFEFFLPVIVISRPFFFCFAFFISKCFVSVMIGSLYLSGDSIGFRLGYLALSSDFVFLFVLIRVSIFCAVGWVR